MIIEVKDVHDASERFEVEMEERPYVGEHLGFGDTLYKILSVIHCFDEYGRASKLKVLVKKVQHFNL